MKVHLKIEIPLKIPPKLPHQEMVFQFHPETPPNIFGCCKWEIDRRKVEKRMYTRKTTTESIRGKMWTAHSEQRLTVKMGMWKMALKPHLRIMLHYYDYTSQTRYGCWLVMSLCDIYNSRLYTEHNIDATNRCGWMVLSPSIKFSCSHHSLHCASVQFCDNNKWR